MIAVRELRSSLRGLLGWAVTLVALLCLYLPLYPSIGGNGQLQTIIDALPAQLVSALGYDQIASGPGYVQATFFGLVGFVLTTVAAVGWGAAAIGGARESGRLELDLSHAVGRRSYVLQQAAALSGRLLALGAVSGVVLLLLDTPAGLRVSAVGVLQGVLALVGLALTAGTAALAGGAASGGQVGGVGAGAAVAVVGYVGHALAAQASELHWLHWLSTYAWAYESPPLTAGSLPGIGALWLASAVFVGVALVALDGRDLT